MALWQLDPLTLLRVTFKHFIILYPLNLSQLFYICVSLNNFYRLLQKNEDRPLLHFIKPSILRHLRDDKISIIRRQSVISRFHWILKHWVTMGVNDNNPLSLSPLGHNQLWGENTLRCISWHWSKFVMRIM